MNRASIPFFIAGVLAVLTAPSVVHAQFGGQPGGMNPGMGPGGGPDETKEEGPAEVAPESETETPGDLEPIGGYPGQQRQGTQILELDGYLRLRTDLLHNFHLGRGYTTEGGVRYDPYFPQPLECGTRLEIEQKGCDKKNLAAGNLRLRLEPTINVTDQVRVHTQIDVLDNTVLGSTADSLVMARGEPVLSNRAGIGALSTTQDPPQIGRNGWMSSIVAKRAWGEVDSEIGSLRFGRMPWHFGRGIAFNNGACADCEGGTTVDRIMAILQLYGHQVAAAWDWGASGHHIGSLDLGRRDAGGPPLDLSQSDDVFQLMAAITRQDDERRFRERTEVGELVVNYGLQLVYRQQDAEVFPLGNDRVPDPSTMIRTDDALTRDAVADRLTDISATVFMPSVWFKLGWRALTIEAEVDGVLGKISNAGPLSVDANQRLSLQQYGWVVASELRLYRNSFFLGFETGGASGDQAEPEPRLAASTGSADDVRTYLNHRWRTVRQPRGDSSISDFKFNPDYQIDNILYRRIFGTVSNSIYVKPTLAYWLDLAESRQVGLAGALLYSMAPVRISTPGNGLSYGVELNVSLTYRNPSDGFYMGATYGVLWPMGALDRAIPRSDSETSSFARTEDASSAQVFRTFLGIRF